MVRCAAIEDKLRWGARGGGAVLRTSSVTLEVMTASEEQHGEVDAAAGRISDGTGCEGGVQGAGRFEFKAGSFTL